MDLNIYFVWFWCYVISYEYVYEVMGGLWFVGCLFVISKICLRWEFGDLGMCYWRGLFVWVFMELFEWGGWVVLVVLLLGLGLIVLWVYVFFIMFLLLFFIFFGCFFVCFVVLGWKGKECYLRIWCFIWYLGVIYIGREVEYCCC